MRYVRQHDGVQLKLMSAVVDHIGATTSMAGGAKAVGGQSAASEDANTVVPFPISTETRSFSKWIRDNGPLFSVATILVSGILATVALYSYVAVFDSSLIWLVEYGDIAKIWIVITATTASTAFFYNYILDDIVDFVFDDDFANMRVRVLTALFFTLFAIDILGDETSTTTHYEFHLFKFLAIAMAVVIAMLVRNVMRRKTNFKPKQIYNDVGLILMTVAVFGRLYGIYIRDFDVANTVIHAKNHASYSGSIILRTGRDYALKIGDKITVIPISEIVSIEHLRKK